MFAGKARHLPYVSLTLIFSALPSQVCSVIRIVHEPSAARLSCDCDSASREVCICAPTKGRLRKFSILRSQIIQLKKEDNLAPNNRKPFAKHWTQIIRLAARVTFVLGALTVTWLSLTPREGLPNVGISDKLLHLAAYAALVVPGVFSFQNRRSIPLIATGLLILGSSLEVAQLAVPGRNASIADASANGIGVVFGLFSVWALRTCVSHFRPLRRQ